MRMSVNAALALLAVSDVANAQAVEPVSEGIHSMGNGGAEVCDLTAKSVAALEDQIRGRSDVEVLQGTSEYNAYAIGKRRVLTFTTPQNRAHPAVACRKVVEAPGNGSTIETSILCMSSRENCDWLYREFETLTNRTIKQMEGQR